MSAIRAARSTGLRTSIAGTQARQTESTDFGSLLRNKARATRGLNKTQMAAYDKQMLTAVQDTKPLLRSGSDRLMVAGVVPGALGVLQPSGADLMTVGDDSQLANVDMQNMLQKQQQTMQMMSNISKSLHDTAMAVIRKIGG
ncbi:MAG: hypothetical protein V3R98_13125 [Alphaproteobacteria bacterium]